MTWDSPTKKVCPQCGGTVFRHYTKEDKRYLCHKPDCGWSEPIATRKKAEGEEGTKTTRTRKKAAAPEAAEAAPKTTRRTTKKTEDEASEVKPKTSRKTAKKAAEAGEVKPKVTRKTAKKTEGEAAPAKPKATRKKKTETEA